MASGKRKVLVVDDDEMLRSLGADLLSDKYDVRTAADGQEGLETALAWRPELVITDLMMPRMHGYELCSRLKGPEGLPGVIVIVASSKQFPADITQAEKAGADKFIIKPYAPADLIAALSELLPSAASEGDTMPHGVPVPSPVQSEPAPAAVPDGAASLRPPPPPPCLGRLKVRFWGTRGSCPVPGPRTVKYGGNTACIEVRIGEMLIILDCGTGIRELGTALMAEFAGRPISGHIFIGHTHWDHIQGFPFFIPLYLPTSSFTVYGVHGASTSMKDVLSGSMVGDYFPIPLGTMSTGLKFSEMSGPVQIGPAAVSFRHLNHPGLCIGFRIDSPAGSVTYIGDHEPFGKAGGASDLAGRQNAELVEFARGSDLVIREAQYTEEEYQKKKGWGHGTFDDAVTFAKDACARRLALFHHDPEHDDRMMEGFEDYCRRLGGPSGVECFAAAEGLCVEI